MKVNALNLYTCCYPWMSFNSNAILLCMVWSSDVIATVEYSSGAVTNVTIPGNQLYSALYSDMGQRSPEGGTVRQISFNDVTDSNHPTASLTTHSHLITDPSTSTFDTVADGWNSLARRSLWDGVRSSNPRSSSTSSSSQYTTSPQRVLWPSTVFGGSALLWHGTVDQHISMARYGDYMGAFVKYWTAYRKVMSPNSRLLLKVTDLFK